MVGVTFDVFTHILAYFATGHRLPLWRPFKYSMGECIQGHTRFSHAGLIRPYFLGLLDYSDNPST